MISEVKEVEAAANRIRQDVLQLAYLCKGPAHIGGALSIADILAVLYSSILKFDVRKPNMSDRDRFILSKGHGVLAYYSALHQAGFFSRDKLHTFKTDGSDLIAHPVMNMEIGIESSNGSLGHGLSLASGMALALKRRMQDGRVYVLVGDGECEEGSVWEAAMLAAKLQLDNLICIVDANGLQSDGPVSGINSSEWLVKRWNSFGWNTKLVNGHDISELINTFREKSSFAPTVIVARTLKGKGVSFMENNNNWHHIRITADSYNIAMEELQNARP